MLVIIAGSMTSGSPLPPTTSAAYSSPVGTKKILVAWAWRFRCQHMLLARSRFSKINEHKHAKGNTTNYSAISARNTSFLGSNLLPNSDFRWRSELPHRGIPNSNAAIGATRLRYSQARQCRVVSPQAIHHLAAGDPRPFHPHLHPPKNVKKNDCKKFSKLIS